MPLLARVRQHDDELTLASFLDRSAAVCGCPSVESFCFDQGLDLRALRKGCPEQLTELAACVGADPALALANAIREVGPRSFELRRCHIVSNMLRTDELALCPACVRDDLVNGPARRTPYDNIWLRIPWHFRGIETCHLHNYRLERFSLARTKHNRRSFVVAGWDAAYQLQSGRRKLMQQKPTEFEKYMVGRLQGAVLGTWLDTIPFSEAVRLCGAFGQLISGKMERAAKAVAPSEGDRWNRDAGFQMLKRDQQSITAFLDRSLSKQGERVTAVAVKRKLGPYLSSLFAGHNKETTGFNVFREEVWAFIKHHRKNVKSASPTRHQCHKPKRKKALTVEDAAVRFALPHDAIQLFASDAVQPFDSSGGLTDAAIESIRSRRRALSSMEEVRRALGIPNGGVWCLADAGLLGSVLRGPHGNLARKFDPSSVSSLLRRLEGTVSAISAGKDWITPSEAAKKYQCGLDTIIQILLSAKMQRVSYDPKLDGLSALRFCEREFFSNLAGVEWFGIPVRQACKRLGVSYVALTGLIRLGFLEQFQFGQGSGTIAYISEASIVAFNERYITAAAAAAIHRRHSSALVRDLEKKGIRPDIAWSLAGANFYLRKRFGL